jgi:corrinoid protein of di/trimethylamine methyltransferase
MMGGSRKEKGTLIENLAETVRDGDLEMSEMIARKAVELGLDPIEVLQKAVINPIRGVGDKYSKRELFLTDLVMSAEAAKAAMKVLALEVEKAGKQVGYRGRIILGTVAGDIHDIGKKIVEAMLSAEGFEIIDLGVDVPTETFIQKTRELKPDILGLSALITITMPVQGKVIEALKREGLRESVKVMVGGAPVTAEWAENIGADAYGADPTDAVRIAKQLVNGVRT